MNHTFVRHFILAAVLLAPALRASTIATYPAGTILENVAIAADGNLFVTDNGSGTIFKVSPAGARSVFSNLPGPAAGIAINTDGTIVAVAGTSVFRIASDGTPTKVSDIAGAAFLNGLTLFSPGTFLAADDTANIIWKVNLATGAAQPWLTDSLLVPPPDGLPIGPNGVKLFEGSVYVTVTGAQTILRVPILPDGSAGNPQVYASSLQADDFAFGTDGSIFAATQIGEIIRLHPDGSRDTIATGTLGDAAVAFGRTSGDIHDFYVVNNGGAFLGLQDGPLEASIIRLSTDTTGVTPESQATPEPSSLSLGLVGLSITLLARKRLHYPK